MKDTRSLHKGLRNYLAVRVAQKRSNDLQDLPPLRPRSRKLSRREAPRLQASKPGTGLYYSHSSSAWRCCWGPRESPLLKPQRHRAGGCRLRCTLQKTPLPSTKNLQTPRSPLCPKAAQTLRLENFPWQQPKPRLPRVRLSRVQLPH